ncbi:MAG: hypothetical protein DMG36_03350 [Acidobacteria bacterium]|nr:MAG: hypothetical protein DMG36_03350 [Acidobacteriota bacterium]
MRNILAEYYRTPFNPRVLYPSGGFQNEAGFFRFGPDIVCYGECAKGIANEVMNSEALHVSEAFSATGAELRLPFDIGDVIENLRRERYLEKLDSGPKPLTRRTWTREFYYLVRRFLPVAVRRHLQRVYLKDWKTLQFPHWPVDSTVDSLNEAFLRLAMIAQGCDRVPFIWFWPDGAFSALILTHDVETAAGRDFCSSLMNIDLSHGFRSSFQVIPEERYEVPNSYVDEIKTRGFEFNIHDLNHDGRLFEGKAKFLCSARRINEYAKKYNARGFRSGAMYHNLDWYDAFFVGRILEIPLTTSQDYSVFHILNEYTINLWKRQISLVHQKNGLLSFITHPDYLINLRCRDVYETLLDHLRQVVERDAIWATLPGEVDRWWRARNEMRLVQDGDRWRIEGPDSQRARVAYASLDGDRIVYTIEKPLLTP